MTFSSPGDFTKEEFITEFGDEQGNKLYENINS